MFRELGLRPPTIKKMLDREGICVHRTGIHLFFKKFEETGTIARNVGSGRPSKITPAIKSIIDEQMEKDNETSAVQLYELLHAKGVRLSLCTILRCRSALGWTFRGSAYCQLIRGANKVKMLDWCKDDDFANVIFTDECSIQMESHRRFACRRKGEAPRPMP